MGETGNSADPNPASFQFFMKRIEPRVAVPSTNAGDLDGSMETDDETHVHGRDAREAVRPAPILRTGKAFPVAGARTQSRAVPVVKIARVRLTKP